MTNKAILMIGVMLIAGAMFSCNKDQCSNVACTHGNKVNANGGCTCNCDTNYQGKYCDTLVDRVRFGFLGTNGAPTTWLCKDTCSGLDTVMYTATIFGDTSSTGIFWVNFHQLGSTDTINAQIGGNQSGFYGQLVIGSKALTNPIGNISSDGRTINFTFSFGNNVSSSNCTGIWVKQ